MAKYTVRLDTPHVAFAGTDAWVQGRLWGERGDSGWRQLNNPGDDHEQGNEDYYRIGTAFSLGQINSIDLAVKKWGASPSWLLEGVFIAGIEGLNLYYSYFYNWILPPSGWWIVTLPVSPVGKLNLNWPNPFIW